MKCPIGWIVLFVSGFSESLSVPIAGSGRSSNTGLPIITKAPGHRIGRGKTSISDDDGLTWSVARDTDIPNPGSSLEVIALADGRWAMAFNDTERGRHSFAIALSDDEGLTWKWKRRIEHEGPGEGGFSYPSLIQTSDGRLHVTYSYKRSGEGATIKHAAFDGNWITQAE